jgi:apolipoprotein N-acyltransferase
VGAAFGLGQFLVGLFWMIEFQAAGAGLVVLLETFFIAAAVALVPKPHAILVTPAALVLAEAVRDRIPFGGLPMAGIALGQVDGPFGGTARLDGALLVLALAAVMGAALATAVRGRLSLALALVGVTAIVTIASELAPDGGPSRRSIDIAVVQGGGRRGFRAVDSDPQDVFDAHVAATDLVQRPVDLVLWPEDVVDITVPIERAPAEPVLSALAQDLQAPLVAGVVEDAEATRFRNAAVLWEADGTLSGRYDKNHRVPYGEYVPGRKLIEKFVDLSVIPRDAVPGKGPGVLRPRTTGPLGVVISYEVYFADRARAAVDAGARVLLVPTNAASFKTSQVPTTEVAAAQLRAIETGRDLAQAAPTGYGALIDNEGNVYARTVLGRRQVLHGVLQERTGRTIYTRVGDLPVIALALAGLISAWLRPRIRRASS